MVPTGFFIADLGGGYRLDGETCVGEFPIVDELRGRDGQVRASVLATQADMAAGAVANRAVAPRIPVTVDLTVHRLVPIVADRLVMIAKVVKAGRSTVVAETRFGEPGAERPVALSHATFAPSPNAAHVMEFPGDRPLAPAAMREPFPDQLGIEVVRPGVAQLDRVPYVMQPTGTIQGGALAALVEVAAETLAGAAIAELDIRYLRAIRVGPARATAERLAPGVVRVEVRDPGNDDRLTTVAVARSQST